MINYSKCVICDSDLHTKKFRYMTTIGGNVCLDCKPIISINNTCHYRSKLRRFVNKINGAIRKQRIIDRLLVKSISTSFYKLKSKIHKEYRLSDGCIFLHRKKKERHSRSMANYLARIKLGKAKVGISKEPLKSKITKTLYGYGFRFQNCTRKKTSMYIDSYKIKHRCQKCGIYNPSVMQFHHVNKKDKLFEINKSCISGLPFSNILQEIKKCVLWCANCHTEFHKRENGVFI